MDNNRQLSDTWYETIMSALNKLLEEKQSVTVAAVSSPAGSSGIFQPQPSIPFATTPASHVICSYPTQKFFHIIPPNPITTTTSPISYVTATSSRPDFTTIHILPYFHVCFYPHPINPSLYLFPINTTHHNSYINPFTIVPHPKVRIVYVRWLKSS